MIKKISCVLIVLVIGFFPVVLFPGNGSISKIGEWGTGHYSDVAVQNNYAYCAAGYAGLDIIDTGTASQPKKIGNYNTPGLAQKVFVTGNYAYVADLLEGLQVIDVSDPTAPTLAGNYKRESWSAEALYVKGKYAYVASPFKGLDIIDVSDPSAPSPVGSYDIYETWNYLEVHNISGVAVDNNYAYITLERLVSLDERLNPVYTGEMHIIDITYPDSPQFAAMYENLSIPMGIQLEGNLAYIGDFTKGLLVLDVSTPSALSLVGSYATTGIRDLFIGGNYAYLARYGEGLQVIDIAAPAAPILKGNFDTPGKAEAVYTRGNYAYIADQEKGLQVVNIANPAAPTGVGNYDTSGNLRGVYVRGNYAYAADFRSGLQILDVSDPSAPTRVSTYDISSETQGVFVKGNYAYTADSEKGLFIVDVSNPAAPFLKGKYKDPGYPLNVYVGGNYAYVANSRGLQVIDVSNPAAPTLAGFIDTDCIASDVSVSGNYAYIADYAEGLLIIDISNPSSPTLVNSYKNPSGIGLAGAVYVEGRYAYLASAERGLDVIDVFNPLSPAGVGHYAMEGGTKGVYVRGNYAYVAYVNQLAVLNISNPATPTLAATYATSSDENERVFAGNNDGLVYMTGGGSGKLYIFRLDEASTPSQIDLNRDRINFGSMIQGTGVVPQSFLIRNGGGGTLNWSVTVNQSWLRCTPVSGTGGGEVTVVVDAAGLPAGTYSGLIAVSDAGAANSPVAIEATLCIYNTGQTTAPFGVFATPGEGATVSGSIPVTGWALDDIGIVNVQLFREEGNSAVYIGDAIFVEGARPDVELAYPGYPMNYAAGWGYMMLTNFLPNGGNGTFTLNVVATDVEGNQVSLGTKTIICDNANAVKPFGAIDTPMPGGSAAGSKYFNWGWVLTPQPNTIPTDGSTIRVWVDGVPLGSPVYNRYREDIATLFPGYNNSNGAVGYFYLDTTSYENGLHTISWSATDTAGNSDGIGSRYFSIKNLPGSKTQESGPAAGSNRQSAALIDPGQWNRQGMGAGVPLRIQKGFDHNPGIQPQTLYPDENGRISVEIRELEHLTLYFTPGAGARAMALTGSTWKGYQLVGNRLRPLPTGSTLYPSKGIFTWDPGPGYYGLYTLVFVEKPGTGGETRRYIDIRILPK